eukprot:scaffold39721_cov27-Phaeocystis_antarctica.AAC.1
MSCAIACCAARAAPPVEQQLPNPSLSPSRSPDPNPSPIPNPHPEKVLRRPWFDELTEEQQRRVHAANSAEGGWLGELT